MIPTTDYIRLLPELILIVFGLLVMLIEPTLGEHNDRKGLGVLALAGTVLSILASLYQSQHTGLAFFGMIRVDAFSIFFHVLIGLIAAVVILASFEYLNVQQIRYGEYYGLILLERRRHDADVFGSRTGAHLYRARDFVDRHLHSCGIPAQCSHQHRVVDQVFPPRLVCHRLLPLRRGSDVRCHRLHQHLHDCRSAAPGRRRRSHMSA